MAVKPADLNKKTQITEDYIQAGRSSTFIFGMERSGTTLLSMMIDAHPLIAVPFSTTGMWFAFHTKLYSVYNGLASVDDCAHLVSNILAHDRVRLWRKSLNRDAILQTVKLEDFGSVVTAVHQEYARQVGKPYWANIDIANLDNLHVIHGWFPDACYLHIIRDGRDVALSHQTMPFGAGNIAECAEAWRTRITTNLRIGAVLGPERYLAVRYEDLILDTESSLRNICDFLKIPYALEMDRYNDTVDERIPQDKMWLWPSLRNPPEISKVFRWKREMKPARRMVFDRIAGPLLEELSYELPLVSTTGATVHALELFYFLDRGQRTQRALQKIGLWHKSKLEREAGKRDEKREMTPQKTIGSDNAEIQRVSFNELVEEGVYDTDFEHSLQTRKLFDRVIQEAVLPRLLKKKKVAVMDAGCGTGVWLNHLHDFLSESGLMIRFCGFDLADKMVAKAQSKLSGIALREDVRRGDLLDPGAYERDGIAGYDFIFCHDTIQQLPPSQQYEACLLMAQKLRPHSVLILFDHDSESYYGRKMAIKKFMTRYLHLRLVPLYYCNAKYPQLNRIRKRLIDEEGYSVTRAVAEGAHKQALILTTN